jgi:predicted ATPase
MMLAQELTMQIESLELENYRLFRHARFADLPRMAVVVGANGSGKSTLFDVFSFLKDALTQNVAQAVARRGGFRELVSRGEEGPIGITVKFRESGGRLATYELKVASDQGRPVVAREVLRFRRGQQGKPWHFVDFSRGKGTAITNESAYGQDGVEEEREERELDDPSVLAIKGLGQFRDFRVVAEFRSLIESWHISDFHIADARPSAEAGLAEHLSTNGENIAQVAQYLYEHHRDRFDRVLQVMRQRVPGVKNVEAIPTQDGRLVLRFQDGSFKDPFIARFVSDGTIKMFAYLVLLYDPKPHPLLAIEEPENQLYPELLHELVEEFRDYARRGGQAFVSTHSPEFLNATKLEEIFWLVKESGFTTARRASGSELLRNLVAEGDLPGALWRQGLFEGAGLR